MKKAICRWRLLGAVTIAAGLAVLGGGAYQADASAVKDYYVSSAEGNDSNNGDIDHPFKTIKKASSCLQPGDTLNLRGGVYRETVDSLPDGTAENPITVKNYSNEDVVISGTDELTGWENVDKNIYRAKMDWSLGNNGDENQLFLKDKLMVEARYPNAEESPLMTTFNTAEAGSGSGFYGDGKEKSAITDPNLKALPADADLTGAKVWMVPGAEWSALTSTVETFDAGKNQLVMTSPVRTKENKSGYYNVNQGTPYYIFGDYSLLDAPMEWWYNSKEGYVYIIPEKGTDPAQCTVEAKKRAVAIDLSAAKYINLEGIQIEAATIKTDKDSEYITMDHIKAKYVGQNSSININSMTSDANEQDLLGVIVLGSHIKLTNSELAYSSGPIVNIQGHDNEMSNCYVHEGNYSGSYAGVAKVLGSRQKIVNNTMKESGRDILNFRNISDSQIEYNDISDAGRLTKDVGIIYSANTDGQNTVIAHNYVHDNHAVGNCNGIYLDEMSQNFIVYKNVVWNTASNAFCVNHPSAYNLVYNNTGYSKGSISNSYTATFSDSRGRQFINNAVQGSGPADTSEVNCLKDFNKGNTAAADEDYADAANADFRLSENSSLINEGFDFNSLASDSKAAISAGAYAPGEALWSVGYHEGGSANTELVSSDQFAARNLVKNGGFEDGSLSNWEGASQVVEGFAWHKTNDSAGTGIYSVQLKPGESISQKVKLENAGKYNLAVNTLKTDAASSVKLSAAGSDLNESKDGDVSGSSWGGGSIKDMTFQNTAEDNEVTISFQNTGDSAIYLDDAGLQLFDIISVSKEKLTQIIDANADKTQDGYTSESWTAFSEALKKANEVLDDEKASQETVDQAVSLLQQAADGLAKYVPVAALKLGATGIQVIKAGKTISLSPSITPENAADQTVTYSFSKEGIVSVDEKGVLTGVKPGMVKVTASAGDQTATVTIRVTQ